MQKVKNYSLIVLTVFVLILAWQVKHYLKKYQDEKADRERLWQNNLELTAENRRQVNLVYTKDEFIRVMTDSTAKLLKSLRIKPKTVTKIVEKTIVQEIHDTIKVSVSIAGKDFWKIKDSGPCFIWRADAKLKGDSLNVNRTLFEYENKLIDVEAKKIKRKFLFLTFYSRKEVEVKGKLQCGESYSKIVSVIK